MTTLIEQTEAYQQLESGLELVAQRVQRAIVGNAGSPYSLNRATLGGGLYSHGGSRDYNRVLGYPTNVSPEDARYWYARDPLTNNAIGSIAYDSWRKFPKFSEGGDEKTPFAREMNGLTKALNLPQMFVRLDKLQRMGAYAGMLFGINDAMPGNLLQANELNRPISPTRGATIERLAVYSQTQLFPAAYDTETIRYGLPTLWHIQTQPNRNNIVRSQNALIEPPPISVKVHWTRIITMSEEPLEHDVLGVSPFGVIANTVIDALKVAGGSAEASYQNIKQKIIQLLKDSAVAKQLGKTAADQADFEKAVQKRVEQFADSMVSYLRAGETESF
ncbi:MAG: anti-CBASS protein Acb1 family protein, partial [Candidatus Promineifilaceae bacterium]